jgi:hypothetical protein
VEERGGMTIESTTCIRTFFSAVAEPDFSSWYEARMSALKAAA